MSEVCHKCSYYLYLIGCSHKHLPVSLLKLLMESLISSRIMCALPVWGPPLLNHQVGCLQRIQNREVRVVFSLKKYDHVSVPREQLGWPNISEEIEIRSLAAFHRHCFSRQCLQLQHLAALTPITLSVRPILLTVLTIIWLEHSNIVDIVPLAGGISYHLKCPASMENLLL